MDWNGVFIGSSFMTRSARLSRVRDVSATIVVFVIGVAISAS
jgi:hypothetical protein